MSVNDLPLITALNIKDEIHLVLGSTTTTTFFNRIRTILRSGAHLIIVDNNLENCKKVLKEFEQEEVIFQIRDYDISDLTSNGRLQVNKVVDKVFLFEKDPLKIEQIYEQCVKLRIPISCFQRPEFSTFNLVSTYVDPKDSGLQISVSTNGQGCLLANRIRREIVNNLPENISDIVKNMGLLRSRIIQEDKIESIMKIENNSSNSSSLDYGILNQEDGWESHNFNKLVNEFNMNERDLRMKRTRWLSQIMEYYPLTKLSCITIKELNEFKSSINNNEDSKTTILKKQKLLNKKSNSVKKGSISLVGSGPGSISMLTIGALQEIRTADLILADKLVPQTVIDLIPERTEIFIAKKFPGNAERAQQELLQKGLQAATEGKKVVRLKQGDPYIFGRGGEEYLYFENEGFVPKVLPGLSSALASTVVSKIPATQRDIADQLLICTGTGRKGALPQIPEYVSSRTTVFLMSLHRADILTEAMIAGNWCPETLVAVVERASCKDQRVTRTFLKYLPDVIKKIGSRPPGLLITGNAVGALESVKFDDDHKYTIDEGFKEFHVDLSQLIK